MEYTELKVIGFNSNGNINAVEEEYQRRLNSIGTIVTNLYPRLMKRDKFITSSYPIFIAPLREISIQTERIINKSRKITNLADSLPEVASQQFFFETLSNEIVSTNEIEGVQSTRKEVGRAIAANKENKKVRLSSTVKMYSDVFNDDYLQIKDLNDIRTIYDNLLDGELSSDDTVDGLLFRANEVFIDDDKNIHTHIPITGEENISKLLLDWLTFINDKSIPFLIKASLGHFFFENTHPFYDGNGRTGRYILSMYLSRKLDKYTGISFSQAVNSRKQKYYSAFKNAGQSDNRAEGTFFVLELLNIIEQSQDTIIDSLTLRTENLSHTFEIISHTYGKQNTPETFILSLLAQSKLFNDTLESALTDMEIRKLAKKSPFSIRSINLAIKKLESINEIVIVKKSPIQHVISEKYFNY